ncbi:bestrophin-2-like [Uloborus diversus]|uniref:bestrophin-2-like n=1 Tax=Uloborus diversus TaxID=327109 RepID=UPI002409265C|nr:bestrophin-2-like [Uloborus diversus]
MTISYSLDVSKAQFGGFTKLLARWKGSIYKILWREFLVFCTAYAVISWMYRCWLNEFQRTLFEKVVLFVETFTDLIPLSFVLGFYVSLVIGRWWSQYEVIPWPDRAAFKISTYVHGSDERSRMIRRTLGRYLILTKLLTFQMVSTAVKKRFPTTQHLVSAGMMTKEEWSIYEKHEFSYGKWWLPCHWFCALAMRAKKEGRIKDSILLDGLLQEALDFRTACAIMIGYDWISVPLVYTQVVTIATYVYAAAMVIGRQYLDPLKGYPRNDIDLYVPFFTLLQFFFYIGWLKVAEQILNPYGEDDDDFELNWCIDRTVNLVYQSVDLIQMKHPKVCRDAFWDKVEVQLPQTKRSVRNMNMPMGSAFYFHVDENVKYLPVDELLEQDKEENIYVSNSMKKTTTSRPSLMRRVLNSGLVQSIRSRPGRKKNTMKSLSYPQGNINVAFEEDTEILKPIKYDNRTNFERLSRKVSPTLSQDSNVSFETRNMINRKNVPDKEATANQYESSGILKPSKIHSQVTTNKECTSLANISNDNSESTDTVSEIEMETMSSIPEEYSRSASMSKLETDGYKFENKNDVPYILKETAKIVKDFAAGEPEICESSSALKKNPTAEEVKSKAEDIAISIETEEKNTK